MFLTMLVRYAILETIYDDVGGLIKGVREVRVVDAKNARSTSEIPKFVWLCPLKEQQFRVFLQD